MNSDMYAILSLAARYFFAGLMVVLVFRAWRITVRDNRRAKLLRDWSPATGGIGQLIMSPGTAKQSVHQIPREGVIGSSSKADVRLKSKDVYPEHAHIEEREGGLLIRPLGRARVSIGDGQLSGDQLFAQDGDSIHIGTHKLLVVLFEPGTAKPNPDKPIKPQPAQAPAAPKDDIDFFDEDELWGKK